MEIQHKVHHDARPYDVANAEAADKARQKLEARFAMGRTTMHSTINTLQENVLEDYLVPNNKAWFHAQDDAANLGKYKNVIIDFPGSNDRRFDIHPFALQQLAEKAGIDGRYAKRLVDDGQHDVLAYNLNERFHRLATPAKYLARTANGQVRGWLSDSYGRYDVAPLLEAFISSTRDLGAVPVEAKYTDTKIWVKCLLPQIFEPIPNEILAFGAIFRNSEVGDGAFDVRGFICRTWCTNDAVTEEVLRQVHLGAKLQEADFSTKTKRLEADTLASATKDVIQRLLSPEAIGVRMETIKQAAEKQIPIKATLEAMRKNGELLKSEMERAMELWTTADVELLPPVSGKPEPGQGSAYRFSNLLSLLAQEQEPARALELQYAAGEAMGFAKKKANA